MDSFYQNLPKKRMAVACLLFDKDERLLIVKPSYKSWWSLPGGVIDQNESPRNACIREVMEEIGIKCDPEFVSVDYYLNANNDKGECLQFMFLGDVLSEKEIGEIKVDGDEIIDYRFVAKEEAEKLVNENMSARLKTAWVLMKEDKMSYLEEGKILGE